MKTIIIIHISHKNRTVNLKRVIFFAIVMFLICLTLTANGIIFDTTDLIQWMSADKFFGLSGPKIRDASNANNSTNFNKIMRFPYKNAL